MRPLRVHGRDARMDRVADGRQHSPAHSNDRVTGRRASRPTAAVTARSPTRRRPTRRASRIMSILRKMPVEHVLDRTRQNTLKRRLSAISLAGFGVGVVIGTGIFTLVGSRGQGHRRPGGGALLRRRRRRRRCWPPCATPSSPPRADGGQRLHLRLRHPRRAVRLDHRLGPAPRVRARRRRRRAKLVRLRRQPAGPAAGLFGEQATVNVGAVLIIAVLTVVAVAGIRESSRLTNALVIVKVSVCVLVVVAGLFFVRGRQPRPVRPAGRSPRRPARASSTSR